MTRNGGYFPAPIWVIPYHGRGMDVVRVEAAWKMIHSPEDVEMQGVKDVYFRDDSLDLNKPS